MWTGFAAVLLMGLVCGTLGVYVVLRRMSFVGHALTHSTLPGMVVAHLTGGSLLAGALCGNALTAAGISWLSRNRSVSQDASIGAISNGMFALGLILMSRSGGYRDLSCMLFGQVLGVSPRDLVWMGISAAVLLGVLVLFHKEWMHATLDPDHALLSGLPVEGMKVVFLLLLVVGVAVAAMSVGAVLTGSLLVAPPAAARLLTRRLSGMMALSAAIAVGCGVGGLLLSYYAGLPSGAAIVVLTTVSLLGARKIHVFRHSMGNHEKEWKEISYGH